MMPTTAMARADVRRVRPALHFRTITARPRPYRQATAGTIRDLARDFDLVTFAVCHGRQPAVVLDLAGQPYDRIVVIVGHPDQIVSRLT